MKAREKTTPVRATRPPRPVRPKAPIPTVEPFEPLTKLKPVKRVIKVFNPPDIIQAALTRFTAYLTGLFLFNIILIVIGTGVVVYLITK